MAITGTLTGYEGTSEPVSYPFQATNCATLPFAPKLTASVAGQGSKADGTTFSVIVESAGLGQANIHKVDLTIPSVLPSRLTTIQKACLEAVFSANPASCDEGSLIGEGIVHTPVFKNPLRGPAYLVSHGGAAFPDVEFVLQGEGVKIVVDGKTYIHGGVTYSKFETSPDAPFTKFETIFPAGPHSALTPSVAENENYNLCKKSITLPTEITGQNGAFISETTPVTITGCKGVAGFKVTKAQQLAKALKACKKDKSKGKRVSCEKAARKKYGAKAAKPQVAARERAVRAPRLGDLLHGRLIGEIVEPVRAFDRTADAEVADRQHVRAFELEHQEHLRRPHADALDRHQLRRHVLVAQLVQELELELAREHVLGQRAQVPDLRPREASRRAQLLGIVVQDLPRRRCAPAEALRQAPVDRARRQHRQLLACDRAHQRAVVVVAVWSPHA
jgi:hypothetical protein